MFHFRSNPVRQVACSVRRLWRARFLIDPTVDDRLDCLGEVSEGLRSEISHLEQVIVSAPKLAEEERLRMMNTIPAPEEFATGRTLRMSRQQIRTIRQRRHKDLLGFVFLLTNFAAVLLWLSYQLIYYSIL